LDPAKAYLITPSLLEVCRMRKYKTDIAVAACIPIHNTGIRTERNV
jgi:hypothetical protein